MSAPYTPNLSPKGRESSLGETLEPEPGEAIYDPTCGSAGMLLFVVAHLKRQTMALRTSMADLFEVLEQQSDHFPDAAKGPR